MFGWLRRKKKQREINVQENGGLMLEELIACSGGKYNPIRIFSSHQILQATNDWSDELHYPCFFWYKGMIENRAVLIKTYERDERFYSGPENVYRDIAVSSMMSSHKNVLKLLGCCLEFPLPALVFEYPVKGSLGGPGLLVIKPLPWNVRLKIATEVSAAVTYLHTEFSRTIIHKDLHPSSIFLDENWTAKLSSFSLSVPIPEGETGVYDAAYWTRFHAEPEYERTGFVTENVDVYSFGLIMLCLLTGKPWYNLEVESRGLLADYVEKRQAQGSLTRLIDQSMLNNTNEDIPQHIILQMEAFSELALRCVRSIPGEKRPRMIDVAKELKRIAKQT